MPHDRPDNMRWHAKVKQQSHCTVSQIVKPDSRKSGTLAQRVEVPDKVPWLYEETGLHVEPDTLTGVYKNLTRGIVALVFRCRAIGGATQPTAEADAFCWLRRHELPDLVAPAYAVRLTDAIDYAGYPAVRAHDGIHVSPAADPPRDERVSDVTPHHKRPGPSALTCLM